MKKYAIANANIISGKLNDGVQRGKYVIVEDGKIAKITSDKAAIDGLKVVDLNGKYLLPGLINLHVHLPGSGMPKDTKKQNKKTVRMLMNHALTKYIVYRMCANYAKVELMSGVTTIRTVGGLDDIDSRIRDNGAKGKLKAPRVLASNMAVSVKDGHMAGLLAYEAKDPEDGRRYVREIAKTNPDLIKLMITGGVLDAKKEGEPGVLRMSPEIVKACCDEAHKLGFKVAAHVESPLGVTVALEGGVDTIEHGANVGEHEIELFKQNGSAHVLTISPTIPLCMFDLSVSGGTPLHKVNGKVVFEGMLDCARKCLENDIPVGLGTDTACPFVTHYDMWRELRYFQKYLGVSNEFAIHTATEVNAKIAGIDNETGTIEEGKSADFMVVDGNPLENLEALRNPKAVALRGEIINNPKVKKFQYVEDELDLYTK
ncbi:MAG TPA: peptidase [Clostridiales bacterium]|nr:peptidase [Clostridiales bacterium]